MASAWLLGRGYSKGLIAVIVILAGADTYQNGAGFQTVSGLTVSGEVEAAQARLDAARADLAAAQSKSAAVKMEKAQCVCPKTKRENRETFDTEKASARLDVAAAEKQVTAAKADLVSVSTPKAADGYVMAVMAFIQLALALLFRALGRGGKVEPIDEIGEAETEIGKAANVVRFRQPKVMTERDMRDWLKIAEV